MNNLQIKKHELYKELCIASYKPFEKGDVSNYSLVASIPDRNGFFACVYKTQDEMVIVFRGTDDIKDWSVNNFNMIFNKLPEQTQNALDVYDRFFKICKDKGLKLTVTGHSLGGSLAAIVGASRGANTVTFNAYGVKQLLSPNIKYHTDNIINYYNTLDPIATVKQKHHIGKCYTVKSKRIFNNPHALENMGSLYDAKEIKISESQEKSHDLVGNNINKLRNYSKELSDYYGRKIILMPGLYSDSNNCNGSYSVRGYERKDGTKVNGYIRECFKHGNLQTRPAREKYKGMKLNQLNKNQLLELLDDLL